MFDDRHLIVLRGRTGVGKTDVLRELEARGAQVLDLEALASHRGSAFGGIGAPPQPSHDAFQAQVTATWRASSPIRALLCEDEAEYIGSVGVPRGLLDAASDAPWIELRAPMPARVQRLVAAFATASTQQLISALHRLRRRVPVMERAELESLLRRGDRARTIERLLSYYDQAYAHRRARVVRRALFTLDAAQPAELAETILARLRD